MYMSGSAGHFRGQFPVKSLAFIPTWVSVKITMGIKSPSSPSMLRGKSIWLFPRGLAAFSDTMGGGGGFLVQMHCVSDIKNHRMCCGKTRKVKILRRALGAKPPEADVFFFFSEQKD